MTLGQAERIEELNKLRFASDVKGVPVIAFTSGKGGTGKTTLALNIANLIVKSGKRVLLVDFDLNFANVHVALNVFPEYTLSDYFFKNYSLENILFEFKPNLFFAFGETARANSQKLTKAKLNEFFYEVKSSGKFDYVLLDTASGGSDTTLDILGFADFTIVIATPEPTAVMDAYAIIKLVLLRGIENRRYVIVNKTSGKDEAQTAFENISAAVTHFLKRDVEYLGFINESGEIKKSAYEQKLFTDGNKSNAESRQLHEIVSKITRETKAAAKG